MVTVALDREVYTESAAARLLRMSPSTLHYWLEGGVRHGVTYAPVIRAEATGRRVVTWAEFIESGWLRTYRTQRSIPMVELRTFIGLLRDELGVPYPLADRRPWVSGRRLVYDLQVSAGLHGDYRLVDEQLSLTYPGTTFMERVDWMGDVAAGWRPATDPGSSVLVRPDVRFGRPAVRGISTASLFEQYDSGASMEEIADDFGLQKSDVSWAVSYETAQRAA